MDRVRFVLIVTLIGCSTIFGCGDDATGSGSDGTGTITDPIDIPEHECGFDGECEGKFTDLTPCEDAVCESGTCVKQTRGTWASCDHPDAGECDGGYCDEGGSCVLRSADDGTPCGQSGWTNCTVGECFAGICQDVSTVDCDDDNPCTDDSCDEATGSCSNTDNSAPCDDNNPCTGDDVCSAGACGGTQLNPDTEGGDVCKCQEDDECAIYDDGDWCNGVWGCVDSVCQPMDDSEVTCNDLADSGGCRANSCNPNTGECEMTPVADYTFCDDGDACTGCLPGVDCGNDGDYCDDGECLAGSGAPCGSCATAADCASLDDGDLCNGVWSCFKADGAETGECAPLTDSDVDCSANVSDCVDSACEPTTGLCVQSDVVCEEPPNDWCDDLNATTYPAIGICTEGGEPESCAYEETVTSCDADKASVCVTEYTGEPCDAINTCDDGEACTDGVCAEACTTDESAPCADDATDCLECGAGKTCTDSICVETIPARTWTFTAACDDALCGHDVATTACSDTPDDACVALKVMTYTSEGACNAAGDGCEYVESEVADCDVPKDGECVSGNGLAELRNYVPTCDDAACDHEMISTLCEQASECNGTERTSYTPKCAEGDEVACAFDAETTDCADDGQLCKDGDCVDPGLCDAYCDLAAATCTDANALDFGDDTCLDACATWTEGAQETDDTDAVTGPAAGNTVACRIYHLTVAAGDPANGGPDVHCAHAAPDGGEVCVDACEPVCDDTTCDNDDGCGGSCGCADGDVCNAGTCEAPCTANCGDDVCGDDGCGGSCGECADGGVCADGACESAPPTLCETYCDLAATTCTDANALDFGGDDCATACATWTEGVQETDDTGVIGPAGGDTVACRIYHLTVAGGDPANGGPDVHCAHGAPDGGGVCVDACEPTCDNIACGGDDGCEGTCGCADGDVCNVDTCEAECVPAIGCDDATTCGNASDGCGGTIDCGTCDAGSTCTDGTCLADCVPDTVCDAAITCGDVSDGCDGTIDCGTCGDDETCTAGACVANEPTICETYCDLATTTCTDTNAIDFGGDTCLDACATWTEGTQEFTADDLTGPTGGDTVACRVYHLTVAGGDPANGGPDVHCAHGAPDGGGVCVDACEPTCDNIACGGDDGCEGTCGCADGDVCNVDTCEAECVPETVCDAAITCGDVEDGCGGTLSCGTCGDDETCNEGTCECVPTCADTICADDGCGGFCGDCTAGETAVDIASFAFNPADITVAAGTTVVWTNQDSAQHSVVSMADDGSVDATGPLTGPLMAQDDTFDFTFDEVGVFDYRCGPHSSMTGSVTVE